MMETIGFLELNSIAKGVEAADFILKAAEVELLFAKPVCPGKYNVLFCGEVAAVTASLEAGERAAEHAVGVMEFYSITAAVDAADAAVKAAEVDLMDVRLGTGIGGKSFVVLTGDVAAVNEAVKAGVATAEEQGFVVSSVVIPNPRREIFESLM